MMDYPDDTIRHAGVLLGFGGVEVHPFSTPTRSTTGTSRLTEPSTLHFRRGEVAKRDRKKAKMARAGFWTASGVTLVVSFFITMWITQPESPAETGMVMLERANIIDS